LRPHTQVNAPCPSLSFRDTKSDQTFTVLILVRLYRYRLTFSSILSTAQTTKSRFLRLYLICCIWLLIYLPIQLYLLALSASNLTESYSWTETHDWAAYNDIYLVASHGVVFWDRWIWLGAGLMVFLFFGCGREASAMYRTGLLAIGLGTVFPSLKRDPDRRPTVSMMSSISSKAKLLLKRNGSASSSVTWTSTTTTTTHSTFTNSRSYSRADDATVSPKNPTFLEVIRETSTARDIEKASSPAAPRPSLFWRILRIWSNGPLLRKDRPPHSAPPMPLADLTSKGATVRSTVSAGQRPVSLVKHVRDTSSDVLVRKEIRQRSEHEGA
jgi:pheromone a factor receptor